jgi:pyruvate formate lyase activating enzyme
MTKELKGLVFNIQRFSIQDGPGIRTTVFMKGCPLTCPWCSNPEGISSVPEIMTSDRKCIGCKKCVEVCPLKAISYVDGVRHINWNLCTNCLECAKVCPSHSIGVIGKYMTVDEAFKVASRDAPFYRNTGGGVTVSGGEPLLQWQFVLELLKKCKKTGLHTTLDTSGYCRWEDMRKVLKYVDLILFDVKHADSESLKETCGASNQLMLDNLKKASRMSKIWLRVPLIPNFNDSESNIRAVAELAIGTKAEKVSLLPYHEYGKHKYQRLGKKYGFNGTGILKPDHQIVVTSQQILESYGLEVSIGS